MHPSTLRFQHAVPCALYPAHPRLAALHAARAAQRPPPVCPRCGAFLAQRTRVTRAKNNSRAVISTCSVCANSVSTPIDKGNAASFPPYRRASASLPTVPPRASSPPPLPPPSSTPVSTTPAPQPSSSKPPTKKKKSALQQMLHRNREQEKKRSDTDAPGLSAFLSSL